MKKLLTLIALTAVLTSCTSGGSTEEQVDNQFVVGMEVNYAPFNWTTLDENDHTVKITGVDYADGYDVMMAKEVAEGLGKELVIKKISWDGLEPALSSGEIDAIIAGMTATPEREENADFTEPYYESEMVMIVRNDSERKDATSIQDFSGATVLGQINTLYDSVIPQIEGVDHATPLASFPLMIVSLTEGDVDALVAELPVATGVVKANPELEIVRFTPENGFVADTSVSIAVKEGNTELKNEIQAILDTIDSDTRQEWMTGAVDRQPASN